MIGDPPGTPSLPISHATSLAKADHVPPPASKKLTAYPGYYFNEHFSQGMCKFSVSGYQAGKVEDPVIDLCTPVCTEVYDPVYRKFKSTLAKLAVDSFHV